MAAEPFWRRKRLADLDAEEWESLCDGCGQCCRIKLEDDDTGLIGITDVVCRLLDPVACRCTNYDARASLVPDCLEMRTVVIANLRWLPETCAYRRVAARRDLPAWHHLVCGDRQRVHTEGASVRGKVSSERAVAAADYESRIVQWIEPGGSD
jgi:uncharacterized cysteine cluster protein YcgN (CxxCxxCC family)